MPPLKRTPPKSHTELSSSGKLKRPCKSLGATIRGGWREFFWKDSRVQIRLEAHFVVLHIRRRQRRRRSPEYNKDIFMPQQHSFLHGKFYCVGAVHFIALWLCKMQSSGWANLRRRRRSSNTMLLYLLHPDLYAPARQGMLLIVKIEHGALHKSQASFVLPIKRKCCQAWNFSSAC